MYGDGEEFEDEDYNITPIPLTSVAGVLQPSNLSSAYVFCGGRYVTIKVIPGTMGDRTARGSKIIVDDWPSLLRTMFAGRIDAVLPLPNGSNQLYFFAGENYALINAGNGSLLLIDSVALTRFLLTGTPNDYVIDGPKNIVAEWPSLKYAGFKTIDAVLPNPLNREQAYFFRGDQYILIHIQQGESLLFALSRNLVELASVSGHTKDHIVDGPRPMWPCLKGVGFKEITMILPHPSKPTEAYVFSRDKYALVNIRHGMYVLFRQRQKLI